MMNTLVSFVWYYSIESIDQLHQIEAPQKILPDKLRFISETSFRIQGNSQRKKFALRRKSRKELQNKIEGLSRLYYGVSQDTIHWENHDAFVLLIEMELSIS